MFKINKEKIYHIQKVELTSEKLQDFYSAENGADRKYKFAVYDGENLLGVTGYRDFIEHRPLFPKIFTHSKNIFQEINRYLSENGGQKAIGFEQCVAVQDCSGKLLYTLVWDDDSSKQNIKLPTGTFLKVFPDYLEWKLDEKCLDFTLMRLANIFVFEEFCEYTYAMSEIIRHHFPKSEIVFTDKDADLFYAGCYDDHLKHLQGNEVRRFISQNEQNRLMYIHRDDAKIDGSITQFMKIYSTRMFFHNVFWPSLYNKTRSFSDMHYLVMDIPYGQVSGLKAIWDDSLDINYFTALRGLEAAYTRWPYNMYSESAVNSCFDLDVEFHFDPSGRDDALVIDFQGYLYLVRITRYTYYRTDWDFMVREDFKKELEQTVTKLLPASKRILSCVNRGSDYTEKKPAGHPIQADPQIMIARAKRMMEFDHYDYIYLATEDQDIYDMYAKAFGSRLISIDQVRYKKSSFKRINVIADIVAKETEEEQIRQLRDYYKVVYILSKCTSLLSSGDCGASKMATEMNHGR
jgi:hypothetical protein